MNDDFCLKEEKFDFGFTIILVVIFATYLMIKHLTDNEVKSTIHNFFMEMNHKNLKEISSYLDSNVKESNLLSSYKEEIRKYDVKYKIVDIDINNEQAGDIEADVHYRKYVYRKEKKFGNCIC